MKKLRAKSSQFSYTDDMNMKPPAAVTTAYIYHVQIDTLVFLYGLILIKLNQFHISLYTYIQCFSDPKISEMTLTL